MSETCTKREYSMNKKRPLTPDEISAIVRGFDPVDWTQLELLAKMPPGRRIFPMLHADTLLRAGLRGAFKRRFPELSIAEINMKVLEYLTPVRMEKTHGNH
jgi:hypothetical protein